MRFGDLLSIAFLNLWRRKLRAFLTVLGMTIGVASIVVMVSLGIGIREATIQSFAGTGSLTLIQVNSWSYVDMGDGTGTSRETELNKKSVEAFRQIPGVRAVMPMVEAYGMLKSGRFVSDVSILGVDASQAAEFDLTLSEGVYPSARRGSTREMVISSYALQWFRDPVTGKEAVDRDGNPRVELDDRFQLTFDYNNIYQNAGGESTQAKGAMYRVEMVGQMLDEGNYSYYCLMDLSTLEELIEDNEDFIGCSGAGKYNQVLVKCNELSDVKAVKTAIENMGYGTYSAQDAVEMAEEQTARIQYLLGAIGGVSLLVAAIGIINTMMMSIYERTREIGIIKVLGCRMSNIAGMFLAESAFIGLFGGALGLGVSFGLGLLLNAALASSGLTSVIPLYLAVGAVAFSVLVGLLAGLYPAIRAMRLSPLAAIRNE